MHMQHHPSAQLAISLQSHLVKLMINFDYSTPEDHSEASAKHSCPLVQFWDQHPTDFQEQFKVSILIMK